MTHICNYEHSGVKSGILSSTLPASWLWGIEQARMIKELPEEYQEAIKRLPRPATIPAIYTRGQRKSICCVTPRASPIPMGLSAC